MAWRLGIDIGTNSIGMAVLDDYTSDSRRDPRVELGVRIFSDGRDPKDRESLAAKRRIPRGMRRNRDRAHNRNERYLKELRQFGLMPDPDQLSKENYEQLRQSLGNLDPYILRTRALDEALEPFEIGRALFQLKRRGFKSNRRTDGADSDTGKIKSASEATKALLAKSDCRTFGEWLGRPRIEVIQQNQERAKGDRMPLPQTRVRLRGKGAHAHYEFYPTRDLILNEFDQIWASQKRWHSDILTDEAYSLIRETLAFQHPLKPQPVGRCTLDPEQERAPKALPSVQRLRMLQEVNHLTLQAPGEAALAITKDQRDIILSGLEKSAKRTFDQLRKALKLPSEIKFNLESESRSHLDGDKTAAELAAKGTWGPSWHDLPLATQDSVVERLLAAENEENLIQWLKNEFNLTDEIAQKVARKRLPAGHGAFCREVTQRLLPHLEADVISYDKAVAAAGYDSHSDLAGDERFQNGLPYYGKTLTRHVAFGSGVASDSDEVRYGKIANPTVHVALNQVRHVVNDLIARHGPPSEIIVELARDLPLSAIRQKEDDKKRRNNQLENEKRSVELKRFGQSDNYENRLRLRLWEELNPSDPLDRRCVYTGTQISIDTLFSDRVEIDHILPFSRTLDDSIGNKTLVTRQANREKGRWTPYEAFAHNPTGYSWAEITQRISNMPKSKQKRFAPDAMERYDNEERDFLARQLVDTQYMARIVTAYLKATGADVWVSPGKLTADLRWALGLNDILPGHNRVEGGEAPKNRNDHRHHAVDALVIALTDRSLLQRAATLAAHQEDIASTRLLPKLDPPWPTFRDDVRQALERLIVSHKPDHGVQGALHNETAYGLVQSPAEAKQKPIVVHRVPLDSISKRADMESIRDETLRDHLLLRTDGIADGKDLSEALRQIGEEMTPPVRRVRICEALSVIPITDENGKPYKAYKGDANYCYDIFLDEKAKWTGSIISRFEANQKSFNPKSRFTPDGKPLLLRLRINDMLELDGDNGRRIMRVVKMSTGQIVLAEHHEAGSLKARDSDKEDSFKYLTVAPSRLQQLNAFMLVLTPSGQIKYRGLLS